MAGGHVSVLLSAFPIWQVDMWAIGVVSYLLLSGRRPFHHREQLAKAEQIVQRAPRFDGPAWAHVSADARGFVQRLLQQEPARRMSGAAAMQHAWIRGAAARAADELSRHSAVVDSLKSYAKAPAGRSHGRGVLVSAFARTAGELAQARGARGDRLPDAAGAAGGAAPPLHQDRRRLVRPHLARQLPRRAARLELLQAEVFVRLACRRPCIARQSAA